MKRALAIALAVIALVSLAWTATPMVLIRPFGAQTASGVAISYALRARAATLTLSLLVLGGAVAMALWPRLATWRGRLLSGAALAALAACAFLGRLNYFEWMFSPLPHPGFDDVAAADHVADDDLVLAVASGDEARGYPVRALAFHHVVNDVIAGLPIVATY
jgi:hypothetical protein